MLGHISKISEIWKSKAFRITFLCLAVLIVTIAGYSTIPYPQMEGADTTDTVYKVSFNAPFTMHFSQSMNKESVENSFKIHPKIKGDFVWSDGKILEYHPFARLDIGDSYRIVIGAEAASFYKKSLGTDCTLRFLVTGPPFVKFVSPSFPIGEPMGEQIEEQIEQSATQSVPIVSSDQVVTVMFDRPMEWSDIDEKDLLIIDPPVSGEYRFLGMSAFQFTPDAWLTGMRFRLKVPAGIPARDGGETEEEFNWVIETSPLHVAEISPEIGSEKIGIDESIVVRFSQPVDLEQIKPGINALLYPSNDLDAEENPKLDGFFNTEVIYGEDADGNKDKTVLIFKPTFSYLPETEYRFIVKAGLAGPSDSDEILTMKEDFELTFKTAPASGIAEFTAPTPENSSIFLTFHTPITAKEITKGLVFTPELPNSPGIILNENSTHAEIICQFSPDTQYTLELKEGVLDASGNEIKTSFKETFTILSFQTKLKWVPDENLNLFIEGIDPEFSVRSKNTDTLNLKLCEISDQNFISINEKQGWDDYKCYGMSESISLQSNNTQTTLLNLTALFDYDWESGIYFFSVDSGDEKIHKVFFVSSTTLVLKKSTNSLLVWATDSITGEPVSRMELVFFSHDGQELARGVTDGNGIYKITRELGEGIYIIGKKNLENENRWVLSNEYWSAPKQTKDGDQWIRTNESRLYLISDKNKILGGESVNIKGILRVDNDAQLTLPDNKQVELTLEDTKQDVVFTETISLRRNGSFDTVIELPLNILPGEYKVVTYNAWGGLLSSNNLSIEVLDKLPSFEMEWLSPQSDFFEGDITLFNLGARYDIGVPAASLRGEWELHKKPYYINQKASSAFYSFGEVSDLLCSKGACPSEEEWMNSGEFVFDPKGIAQIVLTDEEGNLQAGYEYKLIATAEGINGKQISKEFSFRIHQGEYYTGLSLKHYVLNSGDNIEGSLIALDPKNYLVGDKRVKISLIHTRDGMEGKTWYEKILGIGTEPKNFSIPITTRMPSGIYKLKAESQDGGGSSELEIYVLPEEMKKLKEDFALFLDQPEYFVGGKANLLINYPSYEKTITALVTYERGGILGYQTVELTKPLTLVEIPITEEMTPNMHVSVTVIRHPDNINTFIKSQEKRRSEAEQRQSEVEMVLLEQELNLLLESDDSDEETIDELKEKIKSMEDANGSLHEADETDLNIQDVQPKIETVSTELIISKRDREIYIDITSQPLNPNPGEEVTLQIHTYDYQNRSVQSVVTLNIIKKEQNHLPLNPFSYFYKPRGSQIFTSSNITLPKNSIIVNQIPSFSDSISKVSKVSYSAYFNPIALVDESGYAEVKLTLPDEYAIWQINAIATNEAKNFGYAIQDLSVKKSLLIHPVTSNFVIPGDRVTISAIMQNLSSEDIEAKVELLADDVDIKGGSKKAILVQAGQTAKINWDVEINTFSERKSLKLTFNSDQDRAETILPIKYFKVSESIGGSGFLENEWSKNMRIAEDAILGIGGLFVSISATPINIIEKYASAINRYTYPSTEKLVSELVAKTILHHPELSDMSTKEFGDEIHVLAEDILIRQKPDGGYAFWKGAESNPWLTAYVLFALDKAGISGTSQNIAIQFLWNTLEDVSISDQLFILWALSEAEQYDTRSTVSAFKSREESSIAGKAFLLMNINNLIEAGQRSVYPYLEKLQSEITDKKTMDEEWIYFEEENGNGLDTNIRTTAVTLLALNRSSENNPLMVPMVKYLTSLMILNRFTPQEGIWIAMALSEFMDDQQSPNIDYTAKVSVNNDTVIKENVSSENINQIYQSFLTLNSLKSPDHINEVIIEKDGIGSLYFDADLTYFLSNDSILPVEEGLSITRNYYDLEDFEEGSPLSELKTGNLYRGVLTLIIPEDLKYVVTEESLPAGIKALSFNPALADSSYYYEQEELAKSQGLNWIDSPIWNFDSFEIEDNRLLIFAENLPAGVYKIDYLVQASLPGRYNHLPASIHQIFNPSVYARTSGEWMEIAN